MSDFQMSLIRDIQGTGLGLEDDHPGSNSLLSIVLGKNQIVALKPGES